MGITALYRFGTPRLRRNFWGWSSGLVVSWAGMRGVVTLAAVFLLPEETPQREVLRLAAFAVVAGTLLVNGTTLPWLVRALRLPAPDPAEDALQAASLVTEASRAGLERLDEVRSPEDPEEVIAAAARAGRAPLEHGLGAARALAERAGAALGGLPAPADADAPGRARGDHPRPRRRQRSTTRCCARR